MKILDRYIWKELIVPFFIGLFIFTFLLLIDKIFDLTDLIINKGVPVPLVLLLLTYILPAFLVLTVPMGFLLAILVAFGRLSADLEIVALKANGVSPLRLLRPVLVFALAATVVTGWLMIEAVPRANYAFKSLFFDILRTQASVGLKERVFNDTFGNFVIYVDEMAPDQVTLRNVFVADERKPDELRIITAQEGQLLSDEAARRVTLRLLNGAVHETAPQALQKYRQVSFRLYDITLVLENPLAQQANAPKGDREMTLAELHASAAKAGRTGANPNPYLVEIHKKYAIPTACLVFAIVGLALGIRPHRGGRWVPLVALLPVVLFYYVFLTVGETLGDAGRIPPWLAMWGSNVVVAILGVYLFRGVVKERPLPFIAAGERFVWAVVARARRSVALPPRRATTPRAWPAHARRRAASRSNRVSIVDPNQSRRLLTRLTSCLAIFLATLTFMVIFRDLLPPWARLVISSSPMLLLILFAILVRWRFAITDRYVVLEFLTLFGYGLALAAVVVIVSDLMTTLDRYVRLKPPFVFILEHFLYRTPPFVYQGLHIVALMSTILLFLGLSRSNELTALKAGGVSLYRVSLPVFGLVALVTVEALSFQEFVLPWLNQRAVEVDEAKIKRRTLPQLQKRTQIWYRSREGQGPERRIYHIDLLDPVNQEMSGASILELGADFRVRRRWDAKRMRWSESADSWELRNGVRREFEVGRADRVEAFRETTVKLPERFQDFAQIPRAPDVMNYVELREYIRRLKEAGHKVEKYLVDLHSKVAFPFAHPIMVLVGIPFALQAPRGGRVIGIALCLVLGFGYFVVHSAALALARTDILPPIVAAWAANFLFATLGFFFFLRART